ncbi:hypothetical protein RN001_007613 [Aquatica leii]|uniref:Uncharacterized protein n=1 Tax=Aquatica leii TaxID=1421715 RepID=A0AAN7SFH9_9COLE|nr:hypothetical protein RN001_007613 [Aquatica leii]
MDEFVKNKLQHWGLAEKLQAVFEGGHPKAARGKLWATYNYMRKNLKKFGLISASYKNQTKSNPDDSTDASIDAEDSKTLQVVPIRLFDIPAREFISGPQNNTSTRLNSVGAKLTKMSKRIDDISRTTIEDVNKHVLNTISTLIKSELDAGFNAKFATLIQPMRIKLDNFVESALDAATVRALLDVGFNAKYSTLAQPLKSDVHELKTKLTILNDYVLSLTSGNVEAAGMITKFLRFLEENRDSLKSYDIESRLQKVESSFDEFYNLQSEIQVKDEDNDHSAVLDEFEENYFKAVSLAREIIAKLAGKAIVANAAASTSKLEHGSVEDNGEEVALASARELDQIAIEWNVSQDSTV